MGVFDSIKLYQNEWTENDSRKFTPSECKSVMGVTVVASKFGKSACFLFADGKRYIPFEPSADVTLGQILNIEKLIFVELKYTGDNPNQSPTKIHRIRLIKEAQPEITFDNPFGL